MTANMDDDEINCLIETINHDEFLNSIMGEGGGFLDNPPPPTPLPPVGVPAGGYDVNIPLVPMPQQQYPLYSQAGAGNQGQQFQIQPAQQMYQQPCPWMAPQVNCVQAAPTIAEYMQQAYPQTSGQNMPYMFPAPYEAAASYPAVPQQTYNNVSMLGSHQELVPVGILNGIVVYGVPPPPPQPTNHGANKRKREDQEEDRPYVKKPPNAFMLFLKEQRPIAKAQMEPGVNSSVINTLLGQRWKEMSSQEQAKYYNQAYTERKLHEQQHPNWSVCDNYGRKRKRATTGAASTSTSREVTQPSKRLCLTQTNMGAPYTLTSVMEAPETQAPRTQATQTQAPQTQAPQKQTLVLINMKDLSELPAVNSTSPGVDIPGSSLAELLDSAESKSDTSDVGGVEKLDQLLMEMFGPPLPPSEPQEEPQEEPQTSAMEAPQHKDPQEEQQKGQLLDQQLDPLISGFEAPDTQPQEDLHMFNPSHVSPQSPTAKLLSLLEMFDSSSESQEITGLETELLGMLGHLPNSFFQQS